MHIVSWLPFVCVTGERPKLFTEEESKLANARIAEINKWHHMAPIDRYWIRKGKMDAP